MIRWAADRPAVVWALATGVVLAGAVAFTKLPLSAKGAMDLPKLTVSASWRGASPELEETYITSPIEAAIQGVRGVRKTASVSTGGATNITVELDENADITMARLAILERMETLRNDLPVQARGSIAVQNWTPDDLKVQPLLEINLVGPYTPGTLERIVTEKITPRISALPGIASVNLNGGGATTGIAVTYNPTKLQQLGIDPYALTTAVAQAKVIEPLGERKNGRTQLSVTLRDQPSTLDDIARLPVRGPGGRVFALGDLASINPQEDSHGTFYRLNGITAVSLSVLRQAGADEIQTAARVRKTLDEVAPTLPRGVRFSIAADMSTDLAKSINDLLLRGVIAFASVLIVLLITLRSIRGSLLVIATAAIAIAGTALSLYLLHVPANMLTLAGLAMGIGIIVQNGLVVVERMRQAPDTPAARAAAGSKISSAVFGSTLTTTVVLLPFLYLQGNARAAFAPFAIAFALALFWSVGTALVFVPAIGKGGNGVYHGWPRLARLYNRMLLGLLRWRYLTMALTLVMLAVLVWGFIKKVPKNSWGNYWGDQRTTVTASISFPKGSDPAELERLVQELESVAVGQPGVAIVRSQGFNQGQAGQVTVEFTPEGGLGEMPWIISDQLTERAVLIGGTQSVSVSKPEGPGYYNGSGGGGSQSHRIRILGYSYEGVRQLALDLKTRLEKINRVRDVDINGSGGWGREHNTSVSLMPDRAALARVGASVAQYASSVSRQIYNPGGGLKLDIDGEQVDVSVQAAGSRERDLSQLSDARVSNSKGVPIRIGDVTTLGEIEGLQMIRREDQQYIRILSYDFRGPQKLSDRTHKAFMASIAAPSGYTVEEETGSWGQDDSTKGLYTVGGLGLLLVLIAVAFVFDSVWAPMMVFLAIPLAGAGVVAAFWITGTAFTREAMVGGILVVGLAVNHTILQIDAAVVSRKRHGRLTGADVFHAASDRVTMIVLVTLTTLGSLIPMAVGTDSSSLFGAIALATAGGTIGGTLGVMFLLPPMMLGFRRFRSHRTRHRAAAAAS